MKCEKNVVNGSLMLWVLPTFGIRNSVLILKSNPMKTVKLLTIIFSMAVLFASCAKDGPTGPAGATGATGAAGPTGPTGPTGNANIKDTTVTVTSGAWTVASSYDYTTISVPQVTSALLAKGEVLTFFSINSGGAWDILNWTSLNPGGYTLDYVAAVGAVSLYFGPATNPNTFFSQPNLLFRFVFITNSVIKQHPNTNWRDISQIDALMAVQNK